MTQTTTCLHMIQLRDHALSIRATSSPLPAPQAQKPIVPPRESLDGDTIFAVGEDDKWSDDEVEPASPGEGDTESSRLTSRKDT